MYRLPYDCLGHATHHEKFWCHLEEQWVADRQMGWFIQKVGLEFPFRVQKYERI